MSKSNKSIMIKPSHRGMLHEQLGVPKGERIPVSELEAAKTSSDPATRKRATFALNARKWNHTGPKPRKRQTLRQYMRSSTF